MTKTVQIQGTEVKFQSVCSLCLKPAGKTYGVERTLTYGRRTILIKVPVPLCDTHHGQATHQGSAERLVGKIGLIAGSLAGLLIGAGLFIYWASSQQGNLAMNLLLAAFAGVSFFVVVWAATAFWLAPLFAEPEAKTARQAVRIKAYWPNRNILRLTFVNDQFAEMVARENSGSVVG